MPTAFARGTSKHCAVSTQLTALPPSLVVLLLSWMKGATSLSFNLKKLLPILRNLFGEFWLFLMLSLQCFHSQLTMASSMLIRPLSLTQRCRIYRQTSILPLREWVHLNKHGMFLAKDVTITLMNIVILLLRTSSIFKIGINDRPWSSSWLDSDPNPEDVLQIIVRTSLPEGELATFWSGHSARHWLPTHAANVGIGKEQRDFLGRWQAGAQERNTYILSAKQAVLTIQREVNRLVCEGHENLTESEIVSDLHKYARDRGVRLVWKGSRMVRKDFLPDIPRWWYRCQSGGWWVGTCPTTMCRWRKRRERRKRRGRRNLEDFGFPSSRGQVVFAGSIREEAVGSWSGMWPLMKSWVRRARHWRTPGARYASRRSWKRRRMKIPVRQKAFSAPTRKRKRKKRGGTGRWAAQELKKLKHSYKKDFGKTVQV